MVSNFNYCCVIPRWFDRNLKFTGFLRISSCFFSTILIRGFVGYWEGLQPRLFFKSDNLRFFIFSHHFHGEPLRLKYYYGSISLFSLSLFVFFLFFFYFGKVKLDEVKISTKTELLGLNDSIVIAKNSYVLDNAVRTNNIGWLQKPFLQSGRFAALLQPL